MNEAKPNSGDVESSNATSRSNTLPKNDSNRWGKNGLVLSSAGAIGVFMSGLFGRHVAVISAAMALLSIPGVLFSIIGLFLPRNRAAIYGCMIGGFAMMYLATIFVGVRHLLFSP